MNMIRRIVEKYKDADFEMVDEFIRTMIRRIERFYDDERLLTPNVEAFLDELRRVAKTSIEKKIENCREIEMESIDTRNPKLGNYENQGRKLERELEAVFEDLEMNIEKMRRKVQNVDKVDSDIARGTRKSMGECLENIVDEYRMNSKKMMSSLEEQFEAPGGYDR